MSSGSACRVAVFQTLFAAAAFGQTNEITALRGNTHALARPENEAGLTDRNRTLRLITINFKPDPAQQAELDKLLAEQQDPASAKFHQWLTPEQYGERLGLSRDDLTALTNWPGNAGLKVMFSAAARNWVAIDGTVETVQRAFHTEIHNYRPASECEWNRRCIGALPGFPL